MCLLFCDPMDCSPPGSSAMGFPGQEYWSGLPFPSPGDLPSPEIEPGSPTLQAYSLPSEPPGKRLKSVANPLHEIGHRLFHFLNSNRCITINVMEDGIPEFSLYFSNYRANYLSVCKLKHTETPFSQGQQEPACQTVTKPVRHSC